MSKLVWDQIGEKTFETGCDHGVLFPQKGGAYPLGVAWNGLINVTSSPSGAENEALYADNIKYLNLQSAEEYGITIECYTYPPEWKKCNGQADLLKGVTLGQQRRNTFGFSWRTRIGNDTEGDSYGYKIHLAYGCAASPSEQEYGTVNDSPEAITFSYEVTTTPVPVEGFDDEGHEFRPVASVEIDSTAVDAIGLKALEEILYGTEETEPRLPLPNEIKEIFAAAAKGDEEDEPVG